MEVEVEGESPSALSLASPRTLSSTLLGMIATSTASSMSSALEQMRAITEQPLMGDGECTKFTKNLVAVSSFSTLSHLIYQSRGSV